MRKKILILGISFFVSLGSFFAQPAFAAPGCYCKGEAISNIDVRTGRETKINVDNCVDATNKGRDNEAPVQTAEDCTTIQNGFGGGVTCTFSQCAVSENEKLLKKLEIKKPILEIIIPNLKFTDVANTIDEDGNIQFPWIGEYIKAAYRFGVSVASILGIVMIIIEGVRIVLSAGGEEKVAGYKHIGRIFSGLCLAWFSYVILYNINSDLVSFQALRVKFTDTNIAANDGDELSDSEVATDIQIKKNSVNQILSFKPTDFKAGPKPEWLSGQFTLDLCKKYMSPEFQQDPNAPSYGVVGNVVTYTCPDVQGRITTIAAMQPALCRAGEIAKQKGYTLVVRSSFRPFKEQVKTYCEPYMSTGQKPSSDLIATPGYSNHGKGIAVDVKITKDGKNLTVIDKKNQCLYVEEKYIRELGEIFISADPDNFSRLESEIWHFEYSANNLKNRIRSNFTFPARCKKNTTQPNS